MEKKRKKMLIILIIFVIVVFIGQPIIKMIENTVGAEEGLKDLSGVVKFACAMWGGIIFYLIGMLNKL